MSEVAGRMAVQEGAKYLEKPMGGRGVLLSGIPGVPPAAVVILGGLVTSTLMTLFVVPLLYLKFSKRGAEAAGTAAPAPAAN